MYEATLMFLDDKIETIILEDEQKEGFVESVSEGKPYIDKKSDVIFWLPPGNLRLMTVIPRQKHQESQPCLKNQNSVPESDSKS